MVLHSTIWLGETPNKETLTHLKNFCTGNNPHAWSNKLLRMTVAVAVAIEEASK